MVKEKDQIFTSDTFFDLNVWRKKLKKFKKNLKFIQRHCCFLFCHTGVIFFCYSAYCGNWIYVIFCKEGSASKRRQKVQVYCIGDKDKKNKDL